MNGGKSLRRGKTSMKESLRRYFATHKAKRARSKKLGGNRRQADKTPLILK